MRSILKAFPIIGTALMLALVFPGTAAADDDDDDDGYRYRKYGSRHHHHDGHYGHYDHRHYGFDHHHHGYHRRHHLSKHVHVVPKKVYVAPPPVYKQDYRWRRPPPRLVTTWPRQGEHIGYDQPAAQGPASTCLMTREYQTQVVVGGDLVPGYGYACLQPDGSWYHGPAVPVERR